MGEVYSGGRGDPLRDFSWGIMGWELETDSRSCRCPDKKILKNKSFRQILDSGDLDL